MIRSIISLSLLTIFSLYALEKMELIGEKSLTNEEIKETAVTAYKKMVVTDETAEQKPSFTKRIAEKNKTIETKPQERYHLKATWQIDDLS